MNGGCYEQIKADLGYPNLDAAGRFATLAEQARSDGWTHVEFLARLVGEQATADRNRRLAARLRYARFPYRRRLDEFDFEFQPSVDRKLDEVDRPCRDKSPQLVQGDARCRRIALPARPGLAPLRFVRIATAEQVEGMKPIQEL